VPASTVGHSDGWQALLGNRFIIGALGTVAILLLTAIVLVAIGHGDDAGSGAGNIAVAGSDGDDETPQAPIGSVVGTTKNTASYRNGPGTRYVILGTIPHGVSVAVVGRNEDNTWLQVRYPPSSNLKGWVDAKLLNVDGDVSDLALAGPGPVASADVTYVPTVAIYEPPDTPAPDATVDDGEVDDEPTSTDRPTRTFTPERPTVTPYRTQAPTPTPGIPPTVPAETATQ
jgi:uncharacterized protein YraI